MPGCQKHTNCKKMSQDDTVTSRVIVVINELCLMFVRNATRMLEPYVNIT